MSDPPAENTRRHFKGPRVVLVGALIILGITAFIVSRIAQTVEPTPENVPERPTAESP